ncbi:hypothetical protein [Roseisolibacter agri]|uniref:Uncharacterized protein n=1 Tax=Roseisolibacter agri TaxID=2014610 RepID=A0AA37V712_9BACT|nr:hypothetical protein [Roseisolibacter agri]GLC26006.1 hypothetical protein rosag_25190 [Roseisolibacter agri]
MSNPTSHATRGAAVAVALIVLGVACRDLPVQVDTIRQSPSRALAADAAPGCAARTPAERVRALREMVGTLPPAAAPVADARLLPAIADVQAALGTGRGAAVAAAVRGFVADVESLRLRAPFEQREALAAEAECLLGASDGGPSA